ncbi:MAG TPA: hypothetical protein VE988_12575 [Gemmataceae bacterium]|nr:hypothetical protein [Gemmataceae bacterium]
MKTVGWIYLVAYALDAVLSLISSYVPGFLLASNVVSTVVVLFTLVAFVLACVGQLKPRKVFIILACFYCLVLGFGLIIGVLLVVQLGPQKLQGADINPQFFRQTFAWFEPVHLALQAVWLCLAAYGLVAYARRKAEVDQSAAVDVQ